MSSKKLQRELHMQRASKQEAAKLAELADMLALVNPPGLSSAAKQRIANRLPVDVDLDQPKNKYVFRWAVAGVAGSFAVLFIILTSLAQSALPDPTVYHAKDNDSAEESKKAPEKSPVLQGQEIKQLESEVNIQPKNSKESQKDSRTKTEPRDNKNHWSLPSKDTNKSKNDWYRSLWSRDNYRWRD